MYFAIKLTHGARAERHDLHSYETHDSQWLGSPAGMRATRQRNGEDTTNA